MLFSFHFIGEAKDLSEKDTEASVYYHFTNPFVFFEKYKVSDIDSASLNVTKKRIFMLGWSKRQGKTFIVHDTRVCIFLVGEDS